MKSAVRVETFELSAKSHPFIPASTTKIHGDYSRNAPPDSDEADVHNRHLLIQKHAETVNQLRKWARFRESTFGGKLLRSILPMSVNIRMPSQESLYDCIYHFFPPRCEILVTVCDFGDGRAERKEVRLADIERGELC